jgi:hypothetical protein
VLDRLTSDHLTTQKSYLLSVNNVVRDLVKTMVRDLVAAVVVDVAIEAVGGSFETLAELILTPSQYLRYLHQLE